MTGTQALTGFVGVIYVLTSVWHFKGGRPGLAIAFFGYALANIGLILAERGGVQ